jgi:hypothetical protein
MSTAPDDPGDDQWLDEWNADDWSELSRADHNHRNEQSWASWLLKLAAVAIALPLVLGLLAYVLILIF